MIKEFINLIDLLDFAFKHIEKHGNHFISLDYGYDRSQILKKWLQIDSDDDDFEGEYDYDDLAIILCEKTNICLAVDNDLEIGSDEIFDRIDDLDCMTSTNSNMMLTEYLADEKLKKLFKLKAFI